MIPQLYKCFQHWAKQTIWVISDTHFGDKDLASGITRPKDEDLVKMINSKVGKKDTLILLGDVGDCEYAKQLKGYKVLICGNHDVGHTIYEDIFDEVYAGTLQIGEKLMLSHEPVQQNYCLNLHGHVHNRFSKNDQFHLNCCADVIGYLPINFNQLMKSGCLSKIQTIHRITIDGATRRKRGK